MNYRKTVLSTMLVSLTFSVRCDVKDWLVKGSVMAGLIVASYKLLTFPFWITQQVEYHLPKQRIGNKNLTHTCEEVVDQSVIDINCPSCELLKDNSAENYVGFILYQSALNRLMNPFTSSIQLIPKTSGICIEGVRSGKIIIEVPHGCNWGSLNCKKLCN